MALVGCWLIVAAIIGKLIALSHIVQKDILVQRGYQRALLGILGLVLLAPGLHALYQGSTARLLTPRPTNYVAAPTSPSHARLLRKGPGVQLNALADTPSSRHRVQLVRTSAGSWQGQSCHKLESLGVFAHNIRQLKYQAFHGQVYFSVGPVNSTKYCPTS